MSRLEIIDAQLHAYGPDTPERPWDPGYGANGGTAARVRAAMASHVVTPESLVAMMEAVGVEAAVLVNPSVYGWDNRFSLDAAAAHPSRFGVIGLVDPARPDVDEQVASWREQTGALGVRVVLLSPEHASRLEAGGYEPLLAAAERHRVPVCVFAPRHLDLVAAIARARPDLQLVVDHLGLAQPPLMDPDDPPFADLGSLLALAEHANVAVKCTAAPTLSGEPYPFADLWPHLHRVLDAFGIERTLWGSDVTRVQGMHTYADAVGFVLHGDELTTAEKAELMGGTLRRVLRWNPVRS
jgi:L-fuconolactonase